MRKIFLIAALAVPLAACVPDSRPAQQAECQTLGGQYRADPEGAMEDECTLTLRNGMTYVVEYDEAHTPSQ